jgi:nucleoside-diphosphate-sugar epimerase
LEEAYYQEILIQGLMHLEEAGDILVTGCAGFIVFHLTKRLLQQGIRIIGLDNMNSYSDVSLKKSRLKLLEEYGGLDFHMISLEENLAKQAIGNYLPLQAGDATKTYIDVDNLISDAGFKPQTAIGNGIEMFVGWYRESYKN